MAQHTAFSVFFACGTGGYSKNIMAEGYAMTGILEADDAEIRRHEINLHDEEKKYSF